MPSPRLHAANSGTNAESPLDDAAVIGCMNDGCTECFSVLFHRYCKLVFAIAWKVLRQRTEAEDIVQEVFLTIFLQRNPYDPDRGSVQAWIAQFAQFKALARRRRLFNTEAIPLEDWVAFEQNMDQSGFPEGILERAALVEQSLTSLSPQQRRTIELVHFDGYTLAETATILKQSLASTRNHYYRGLKSLRVRLRMAPQSRPTATTGELEGPDMGAPGSLLLGVKP